MKSPILAVRDNLIVEYWKFGWKQTQLAELFNLTQGRIYQVIHDQMRLAKKALAERRQSGPRALEFEQLIAQ